MHAPALLLHSRRYRGEVSTLLVSDCGRCHVVPLAPSTLIGRHWACPVRLADPSSPLYWLEVRWLEGGWGWRALGGEERTHGGGTSLPAGWRALTVAARRAGRVRLSESTWIELVEADAPRAHLVRLSDGAVLDEDAAVRWAEVRLDAVLPLDAEGDVSRAFPDGHVLVQNGDAVRVHAPGVHARTLDATVDLSRSGVYLDVDLSARAATFSGPVGRITVRGECVRVLEVYRAARVADIPAGGWLAAAEALDAYVALGGPPDAPIERLSWERCRLRAMLTRAGGVGVGALFDVAPGRDARVRLSGTFGA